MKTLYSLNQLTQCCTQFKPFGTKTFCSRHFPYHLNMNVTLSCKYNTQRILIPEDLNWVEHWVGRLGLSWAPAHNQDRAESSGSLISGFSPGKTGIIGSLSTRVFESRKATGREYFMFQDSGVSQIFILIISNGEKILGDVNVVVWRQVKKENSSLPVAVRVSKTHVLILSSLMQAIFPRNMGQLFARKEIILRLQRAWFKMDVVI